MFGARNLMIQKFHVIIAVHVASLAVEVMSNIFCLVFLHGFEGIEMLETVFVTAFDLARHDEDFFCLTTALCRFVFVLDSRYAGQCELS